MTTLNTNTQSPRDGRVDPLHATAQRNIVTRLRQAVAWAEDDLAAHLTEFRNTIEAVQDQADAWVVSRLHNFAEHCNAEVGVAPHVSRLRVDTLPDDRQPVAEFQLIPFGQVTVERPSAGGDFEFTAAHAASAKRWFDQLGRKLAIDYEHQSFDQFNSRPDGLRPAAGWIGSLEVRNDGLWATEVNWTDRAAELLRNGEYRYFSPVIYWTDEDYSDVAALGPVALTNDPAMRGVPSLTAARRSQFSDGLEAETTNSGTEADTSELESSEQALSVLRSQLDTAADEIATLQSQLREQEADAFIERGLRLGKILDSTSMEWRADFLRSADDAEQRLQRAPVLLPPGRVIQRDTHGRPLGAPSTHSVAHVELFRRWGIEPEDIAAYEQACDAGRVRTYGAPATR